MTKEQIFSITKPHPSLMTLYLLRTVFIPPAWIAIIPLYFRYHTMRFRFDEEGIGMSWGILFRREINLTYSRIQDIHLTAGPLQRWLGLADVCIQTASGSAQAEMTLEGLLEFEAIRDFLYTRMRGYRDPHGAKPPAASPAAIAAASPTPAASSELVQALRETTAELRAARLALERLSEDTHHD